MKDEIAGVGEVDKRYIAVDIVIAIDWYVSIHIETHIHTRVRGLSFIQCIIAGGGMHREV